MAPAFKKLTVDKVSPFVYHIIWRRLREFTLMKTVQGTAYRLGA